MTEFYLSKSATLSKASSNAFYGWRSDFLNLATDFHEPPAQADEKKTPVVEELGLFAFKGMADELKNPADDK